MKSIEKFLKNLALGFFRLFFGGEKLVEIPAHLKNPQRILAVRSDARLGNLVFCLPFLNALRKKFPGAKITFLVSASFADLLEGEPFVDEVLTYDKKRAKNPFYLADLISTLKQKRFDWCFDLGSPATPSFTNSFLCALSGVPVRMAYRHRYSETFGNLLFEKGEREALFELFLQLLEKVAPGRVELVRLLHLTAEEKKPASDFFAGKKSPKIGLFLGGRGIRKWEAGKWFETARKLVEKGFAVFVFYGPDERGEAGLFASRAGMKLVEPRPLREFAAILSGLDSFIACATGPLHLASALGVPVIGLYFPPDLPERYAPPGKQKTILYKEKSAMISDLVIETAMRMLKPSGKTAVQTERAVR
jgi:ADP-heptose:LPS heptosyltransferase